MSETKNGESNIVNKILGSIIKTIKWFFKFFLFNKFGRVLAFIVVLLLAGYFTYTAGERAGAKKQLAIDKKNMTNKKSDNPFGRNSPLNDLQKRKTLIGNIVNVSDKSIEIKPKTGDSLKAKITKETVIYGLDREKTDYKALKKDQLVYITSKIEDDKSYTASRIRVQK